MTKVPRRLLILLILAAIVVLVATHAGEWLVINAPERSDVIVVLRGDIGDIRFQRGLSLLRDGYAQQLVLDAPDWIRYGRTEFDLAQVYVKTVAPDKALQVHVCSFHADSTMGELREIAPCIHTINPRASTAILVSSDFHTRRALSIARHSLPEYRWSVAAAPDAYMFGTLWWHNREWAKTTLMEWQKLCWWHIVERWRSTLH
jgi:uncharacterized SAM-binding protein YcdF (DUF218 family)